MDQVRKRGARSSSFLLAAACAHTPRLVPASEAQRLPDDPEAAVASAAGVQVAVRSAGSETGAISSRSSRHFSKRRERFAGRDPHRYRDFTLTSADGLPSPAIPPLRIHRPGTKVVAVAPAFAADRFLAAPAVRR
jgi:hypothetical protein